MDLSTPLPDFAAQRKKLLAKCLEKTGKQAWLKRIPTKWFVYY